jgi:Protein of unknown function (DUF3551)
MVMKAVLLLLGILAATAATCITAEAQNYPWCVYWNGTGGARNCGFVSYEQCMETARGAGASCARNTQYQPPPGPHAHSPD